MNVVVMKILFVALVSQMASNPVIEQYRQGLNSATLEQSLRTMSVSTDAGTKATGTFHLGRFLQRRYELGLRSYEFKESTSDLNSAIRSYGEVAAIGQNRWLSDALFYSAIAAVEKGQRTDAAKAIDQIKPESDSFVYLDDVVWTASRSYSIQRQVPSQELRNEVRRVLGDLPKASFADADAESLALAITKWARLRDYRQSK